MDSMESDNEQLRGRCSGDETCDSVKEMTGIEFVVNFVWD
jgi:hypothetical protein